MMNSSISRNSEIDQLVPVRDFISPGRNGTTVQLRGGGEFSAFYSGNFSSSTQVNSDTGINLWSHKTSGELDFPERVVRKPLIAKDTYSHDVCLELIDELMEDSNGLSDIDFFERLADGIEVLSNIDLIHPDAHSVEYLEDDSLFFTILKGDFSIYLGYYFESESESNCSVSIFKENESLPTYSGLFEDVWGKVLEIVK